MAWDEMHQRWREIMRVYQGEGPYFAHPTRPRPPWWKPFSRRRWDKEATTISAIANTLWCESEFYPKDF